jgi:pyruvate-formate lyase-activating enzyme
MRLDELVGLRPVPCAGLLVSVTRRCPLSCAHCSSSSTADAEEPEAAELLRFFAGLGDQPPEVVMLTGGEPLLLPDLTARLAGLARAAGSRTALLSGMFFVRGADPGRIPRRIAAAIAAVDHFSASLDAHHEREVPREAVLRAVRTVLDGGTPVSFHITGTGADDPYLADVTAAVRRAFGDQVPMLVNRTRAVGRAAAWAGPATVTAAPAASARASARDSAPVSAIASAPVVAASAAPAASAVGPASRRPGVGPAPGPGPGQEPDPRRALPCAMAAWPVIAPDGTVLACCNQDVVDRRPAPAHLRLGHIATDRWPEVRARALASPVLRMVRTVGPLHLAARHGAEPAAESTAGSAAGGYCASCRALAGRPDLLAAAERDASGAVGALLDAQAGRTQHEAGAVALVRRHGCAPYADLVALPSPSPAGAA